MMPLDGRERELAETAADVVRAGGGFLGFEAYDRAMLPKLYYPPFNWIAGWGLAYPERKANTDKLCAFAAVTAGLLQQTDDGYRLTDAA
jgi:hypothetical protein